MLIVLLIAGVAYAGWRVSRAASRSLRSLPRRNEDMVFF